MDDGDAATRSWATSSPAVRAAEPVGRCGGACAVPSCLGIVRRFGEWRNPMGGPVRLSVMRGHDGDVSGVACIDVRGRATAVSAGEDGTLRRWNLMTGEPDGPPVAVPGDGVTTVACTVLDGRPVAVTGG